MGKSKGSIDPRDFVKIINNEIRTEWEGIEEVRFNPNTKGKSYEESLKDFFKKYMGGPLDFHIRSGIIDNDLQTLKKLSPQENEFDVVGTFKNSIPRIIIEKQGMKYVPLDSVAFISEVKQDLTKINLEKDLKKFSKISGLESEKRFGTSVRLKTSVNHVLKTLIYFNTKFRNPLELLDRYKEHWDFIVMIKDDMFAINPKLPITGLWQQPEDRTKIPMIKNNALFYFMITLSGSFTYSLSPIATHNTYLHMLDPNR